MNKSRLLILPALLPFSLSFSQNADSQSDTTVDTSAIYLYDRGKLHWTLQNNEIYTSFDRRYQILVLDSNAVSDLSRISIRYISKDGLESLDTMQVSVSGENKKYVLPDSSFTVYSVDEIWTENRVEFSDLVPGDTVNVFYSIRSKPTTDIQSWLYQQDYPVKKSFFSVMVPEFTACTDFVDAGFEHLHHKQATDTTLKWGNLQVRCTVYHYELSDLKPVYDEPYAPNTYFQKTKHVFCFHTIQLPNNLMYLSDWRAQCVELIDHPFWGRQFKSSSNSRWLEKEAAELLKQPFSDQLMANRLYTFVNESFRWNGSFGLFPELSLREMQYSRYNNRSGINMALLALCRAAKLKAYPVLFASKDRGEVYREIPNIEQFDHMVVALLLGRDTVFLDAGDSELPPGLLHPDVPGEKGLFIRKYKINWITPDPGYAESNMLINLKTDQSVLKGSLSVKMDGYDGYHERILISQDYRAKHWKERLIQLHPAIQIDSIKFKNVERVYQPLELILHFHFRDISLSDSLALVPGFYSFFSYNPFISSERNAPVQFPFQISEDVVINYLIPDHMSSVNAQPKRYKINDSVQMELYTSKTGPFHQVRYRVFMDQVRFRPEQYESVRVFFERVQNDILTPIRYTPVSD